MAKRAKAKTAATGDVPAAHNWPTFGQSWPLDKIKPYSRNPRTHPPEQIKLLAELILKYGPDQPIAIDEDGVILKGHGRLEAAKFAKLAEFPVVIHAGLSEEDKKAVRIADNQVSLLSGWDQELLRIEVGELRTADFEMPLLGFDRTELNAIETGLNVGSNDGVERGALLERVNVTIDDPKNQPQDGDHYTLTGDGQEHHLFCLSVIKGWPVYMPFLQGQMMLAPYPGVFVPFSQRAKKHALVMVTPDGYTAGHILDRWQEAFGKKAVSLVSSND